MHTHNIERSLTGKVKAGITRTALCIGRGIFGDKYSFSKLYDPEFTTEYRNENYYNNLHTRGDEGSKESQ